MSLIDVRSSHCVVCSRVAPCMRRECRKGQIVGKVRKQETSVAVFAGSRITHAIKASNHERASLFRRLRGRFPIIHSSHHMFNGFMVRLLSCLAQYEGFDHIHWWVGNAKQAGASPFAASASAAADEHVLSFYLC